MHRVYELINLSGTTTIYWFISVLRSALLINFEIKKCKRTIGYILISIYLYIMYILLSHIFSLVTLLLQIAPWAPPPNWHINFGSHIRHRALAEALPVSSHQISTIFVYTFSCYFCIKFNMFYNKI